MYKVNRLLQQNRRLFHTGDLAVLWDITNRNTLYTTIKRYCRQGIIHPIFKGLYATLPIDQLDPLELGAAIIHDYCYITTETVLAAAGVISQATYAYTFAAPVSKRCTIGPHNYRYRRLQPQYLYNPIGIETRQGVATASTERAVADLLYFSPRYHLDMADSIDWDRVQAIQKEVGYHDLA